MANGNGSDWLGKIGGVLRTAGPWGVIVMLSVLVALTYVTPIGRSDPFTGSDGRAMREALDEKIFVLTDMLKGHVSTPHHYATAEVLAEFRTDQKHLLSALDRLDKATAKVLDTVNDLRATIVDHESRLRSVESPK